MTHMEALNLDRLPEHLIAIRASPDYIGGKEDSQKSSNVIDHGGTGMEASKHGATIGG
jgi:hypothetical protein